MMKIAEIFYSIQGEGRLAGIPSVFVRTWGCNLDCTWCDTRYASSPGAFTEMTINEIAARVLEKECAHCVITGGEPMIQDETKTLAGALHQKGVHVTVETNATIAPEGIICDLASLSPKLFGVTQSDSGKTGAYFIQKVLESWMKKHDFQLKLAVRNKDDVRIASQIRNMLKIGHCDERVFLMPISGCDAGNSLETEKNVAELCKQHGFRYCHRIQRSLYGNAHGV